MYDSTPSSSRQAVKFTTAATIGSISLVSCGFTFTGTVLVLILSTPILVLFSPILVPAAALWMMYRFATGEKIAERGKEYGQRF